MRWKIEVGKKPNIYDHEGAGIVKDITDLGIKSVMSASVFNIYIIDGDIEQKEINYICINLLSDPITEEFSIKPFVESDQSLIKDEKEVQVKNVGLSEDKKMEWCIEVYFKKGVADPAGENTLKGIRDLGIKSVNSVLTAKKYILRGELFKDDIENICKKLLANVVINDYFYL